MRLDGMLMRRGAGEMRRYDFEFLKGGSEDEDEYADNNLFLSSS
jgi:hypothetical protein